MRWVAALLLLLLAPSPAWAHGTEPAGHAHPGDPAPGAWPPQNGTNVSKPAEDSGVSSGAQAPSSFEGTVSSPGVREWRTSKGDPLRTGWTQAQAPLTAPVRRWDAVGTRDVGYAAAPLAAHGLVVFAGLDGKVHAVDASTGFGQWTFQAPGRVLATPAVAEGLLVVPTTSGAVLALDLRSGAERWRAELGAPSSASPLALQGVVVVASEAGRVAALDLHTGAARWNRTLGAIESLVSPMWVSGRVIVGDKAGVVVALHTLTGQTLWTSATGTPVTATPVGAGNRVLVPTLGLKLLEMETGRVIWYKPAGAFVRSSPAYFSGAFVYGDPDAPGLMAASAFTGEKLWSVPTRLWVRTPPVVAGELAVGVSEDGTVVAAHLRNGTALWTQDAGERVNAPVVVLDGRVLVARLDGVVRLLADPTVEASTAARDGPPAGAASNGFVGLLPVLAVLVGPYVGLKWYRDRLRRDALAAPAAAPVVPIPPPPEPRGPTVRVACPRCDCRFGIEPRHLSIVDCPGCGLRSVVHRRRKDAWDPAGPGSP